MQLYPFPKLSITLVRKLTDRKIRWIIREVERGTDPDEIARFVRVTKRRINQLKRQYKDEGIIPHS
jgi:putative transposase